MTDLSRSGLARHINVRQPEMQGQPLLEGRTAARMDGMEIEDPIKMWSEDQKGRCQGCKTLLPLPDESSLPASEEMDTVVCQTGPVFLVDGVHRTSGSYSRDRHWYCIACAVNHPNGQEARRKALEEGWGQLFAWAQEPFDDFPYLSLVMHSAAKAGASSGLPRLSLAGLKYGDLWILQTKLLGYIARCQGTKTFPLERPARLEDRIRWSGPLIAPLMKTQVWREIQSQFFVMLESSCFSRHDYSATATPPKAPVPVAPAKQAPPIVLHSPHAEGRSPSGGVRPTVGGDPFADPFNAFQSAPRRDEPDSVAPDTGEPGPPPPKVVLPDLPLEMDDDPDFD